MPPQYVVENLSEIDYIVSISKCFTIMSNLLREILEGNKITFSELLPVLLVWTSPNISGITSDKRRPDLTEYFLWHVKLYLVRGFTVYAFSVAFHLPEYVLQLCNFIDAVYKY